MKAKKSLGQNFLKSQAALNKIVEAGNISVGDTVLEIGPGQGALTAELLETGAEVVAVEKDSELIPILKGKFSEYGDNFELIEDDVLEFDENSLGEYMLIANIPYYITGAIIRKFLSSGNKPKKAVLLVQKEVAKRIIDEKGSLLSISVRVYCNPKYEKTVLAGSFSPAPKVDSAIISLNDISGDNFKSKKHEDLFFEILHAGFGHKRKRLLKNIKDLIKKYEVSEDKILSVFENENMRAEELGLEDWLNLTSVFLSSE